jgi:thiamine-phosphate pyrophosphorylase
MLPLYPASGLWLYNCPQTARLQRQATPMASQGNRTKSKRAIPRLYLVTPAVADPAAVQDMLGAAMKSGDVAAVLLRLAAADERTLINRAKALAPLVQDHGAALLLEDLPDIAAHVGADGAHLSDIAAFEAALGTLKPARIAGCGGLQTRHDAMLAAEAGADYVMFGEPDQHRHRPSLDAVVERVDWWAELFEIPCVGFAGSMEDVAPLADAGAEFIALGDWIFDYPQGAALAVAEAASRLAPVEAAG